MKFALILSLAILIDNILGDPKFLFHPVTLIGKLINFFEYKNSFVRGFIVCFLTVSATGVFVFLILYISNCSTVIQIYLLYSALAWKDLKDETELIFVSLLGNNIRKARKFLSQVVGRDTENLNYHEIITATIETISENSIDSVISVIFFAALGYIFNRNYGICVSVWIFKAVNTLDSMIGYRKFQKFGTPSAKLDDIFNFIPARIGAVIIILSGAIMNANIIRASKIFLEDRKNHSSPNSAHGESAFSGVLNIRLGGPAFYDKKIKFRKFINVKAREAGIYDILRAWKLLDVSCSLFSVIVMFLLWKI